MVIDDQQSLVLGRTLTEDLPAAEESLVFA
jgi:hypothetical protein